MADIVEKKDSGKIPFVGHVGIMFALGIGISLLPPFGQITPMGMDVLGVFAMLIYGWIFLDILWISVLGFVLLAVTGVTTVTGGFTTALSNQVMPMLLVLTALAAGLESMGVGDVIAGKVLSIKALSGRPWLLVIALCAIAFILSVLNKGILGMILLWTVVGRIGKICGYEPKSHETSFICLLVAYCAIIPITYAPYNSTLPLFGGFYTRALNNMAMPMGQMFLAGLLLIIVSVGVMILLGKFVFRLDMSRFNLPDDVRDEFAAKKMDKVTKLSFIGLIIFIVLLLIPYFVSKEIPAVAFIDSIGVPGWGIVFMCFLALLKKDNGQPAMSLSKAFAGIPWSMIMLFAVTLPLGNAMSSADVGIMSTLAAYITPILSNFSVFGIYVFAYFFLGLVTQILHNMVVGVLFLPLFGPVAISLGADPFVLFFIMFSALGNSFATPAASMWSGFVFGSEQVKAKYAYIYGFLYLAIMGIVIIAMIPFLNGFLVM